VQWRKWALGLGEKFQNPTSAAPMNCGIRVSHRDGVNNVFVCQISIRSALDRAGFSPQNAQI
jgi:hypothetical protein